MARESFTLVADSEEAKSVNNKNVPWWTSSRLGLAILGFFGFVNVYALRVNMSVAIVCMVNQTALKMKGDNSSLSKEDDSSQCRLIASSFNSSNETYTSDFQDGEYVWDKTTQGLILGSFFWGYLFTQIPGGWLATKIGGKRVYGYSMLCATIATFLTPIAAQNSYIFLIVLRVFVGIASGVCYPSMHAIWGQWAPPMERSKLVSFTYAGAQVGNVITFPLAGMLCKYGFAGGWPSIFYVLGILSLVWFVLWMLLVSDTPAQHKRITKAERDYITGSLADTITPGNDSKSINVPWKKMATSLPVLGILVANITSDWGTYTLLTSIPTYMSEVLKLDISTNGLYSALPYIAFWAMINISGWVADFALAKSNLSIGHIRKIFTVTGMLIPAVMLIILGYIDCTQPIIAIVLLTLGVSLTGIQYSGWVVNHMDIAPAFAGILFGISNSIAAVTGFLSPVIVGIITKDQTREQWQIVFYTAAATYGIGSILYTLLGQGEVQKWAKETQPTTMDEIEKLPTDMEMKDLNMEEDQQKLNGDVYFKK